MSIPQLPDDFLSADGEWIHFVKPIGTREGVSHLLVYFDGVEVRYIITPDEFHMVYIYFTVRGKCSGMVSTRKYLRVTVLPDTMLPIAIAVRNSFLKMTYDEVAKLTHIRFKAGELPELEA